MRVLPWVVLLMGVLWGGYWFVGSRALNHGAEAWFAGQAKAGLIAEHDSLSVQGFPNRFDLTVNGLHLADPATGYGWTAPFVQLLSLSYTPWHWIAALPPQQTFQTPFEDLTLASTKLQGSIIVVPGPDLALDRITVVGDALSLGSSNGWTASAQTLRFATRQTGSDGLVQEVGLEVLGITPDQTVLAALPGLAAMLDRVHLDANVTLTAPLDRHAEQTRPEVAGIEVKDLSVTWGDLGLSGKGTVTADAEGRAAGKIDLHLMNWRKLIPVAIKAGLVTPEVAPTWEKMLALFAQQSGDPNDLALPLGFKNGRMSLGPLPLGPAPRMN